MQRRENEAANPSSEASSFPLVDFISKVSDKMSCKEFKKNVDICRYILQILLVYPWTKVLLMLRNSLGCNSYRLSEHSLVHAMIACSSVH